MASANDAVAGICRTDCLPPSRILGRRAPGLKVKLAGLAPGLKALRYWPRNGIDRIHRCHMFCSMPPLNRKAPFINPDCTGCEAACSRYLTTRVTLPLRSANNHGSKASQEEAQNGVPPMGRELRFNLTIAVDFRAATTSPVARTIAAIARVRIMSIPAALVGRFMLRMTNKLLLMSCLFV